MPELCNLQTSLQAESCDYLGGQNIANAERHHLAEAGSAIVHPHLRNPHEGSPDQSPESLEHFLRIIKVRSNAVVKLTTGGSPQFISPRFDRIYLWGNLICIGILPEEILQERPCGRSRCIRIYFSAGGNGDRADRLDRRSRCFRRSFSS